MSRGRRDEYVGSVVFMDVVFSIVGARCNDYFDTVSLEVEEQRIHLLKTNGHWHELETAAAAFLRTAHDQKLSRYKKNKTYKATMCRLYLYRITSTVFTIHLQRTHAADNIHDDVGSVVFMDVVFSIVGVRRNDFDMQQELNG